MSIDPHKKGAVLQSGVDLNEAAGVVILLHGRGGSAKEILSLEYEFRLPQITYLAPQAHGSSWYPNSFLAPVPSNQPWLTSALTKVQSVLQMAQDAGIATENVVIAGFSQGACLATEFVARHARRYGGLVGFTGGLVGPLGSDLSHGGDLAGTPVFLGSGDPDVHVPWERVRESAQILVAMGADVTVRRYEGRSHTISHAEFDLARRMLRDVFLDAAPSSI